MPAILSFTTSTTLVAQVGGTGEHKAYLLWSSSGCCGSCRGTHTIYVSWHTHMYNAHTHFVRETMSQQPINPLWSIRDTAGQKSLSTSLRTPRQAIQYKGMFEARRLSASSIGECVCTVHSTLGTLLIARTAHTHTHTHSCQQTDEHNAKSGCQFLVSWSSNKTKHVQRQ